MSDLDSIPDWLRRDLRQAVADGDKKRVKELTRHAAALAQTKETTERDRTAD